jgi:hypothetical protein
MSEPDDPQATPVALTFEASDVAVADGWITREARFESASGDEYVVLVSARSQDAAVLDATTSSMTVIAEDEPADSADPHEPPIESPSGVAGDWTSNLPPDLGEDAFIVLALKVSSKRRPPFTIETRFPIVAGSTHRFRASNGAWVSCTVTEGKVRFSVSRFASTATFEKVLDTGDEPPKIRSDGRCSVKALDNKKAQVMLTNTWQQVS